MVAILEAPSHTDPDMLGRIRAHGFWVKAAVVFVDTHPDALTSTFGVGQMAQHIRTAIALGAIQMVVALDNMNATDPGFDQEQYQM